MHVDIGSVREKSEGLVDDTPGPVARAVGEAPELSWAGGKAERGSSGSRLGRSSHVLVPSAARMVRSAHVLMSRSKCEVVAAESDRAEEGMYSMPPCGGEVERRIRAQSSKTTAPDQCGGVWSDEVPLLGDDE